MEARSISGEQSFHRFLSSSNVHGRRVSRKARPLRSNLALGTRNFQSRSFSPERRWSWSLLTATTFTLSLPLPKIIEALRRRPCSRATSSIAFVYMQIGRNSCLKSSRKLFASDRAHVTLQLPQEMKFNGFDPSSESFLFVQSLLCSIFKFFFVKTCFDYKTDLA